MLNLQLGRGRTFFFCRPHIYTHTYFYALPSMVRAHSCLVSSAVQSFAGHFGYWRTILLPVFHASGSGTKRVLLPLLQDGRKDRRLFAEIWGMLRGSTFASSGQCVWSNSVFLLPRLPLGGSEEPRWLAHRQCDIINSTLQWWSSVVPVEQCQLPAIVPVKWLAQYAKNKGNVSMWSAGCHIMPVFLTVTQ